MFLEYADHKHILVTAFEQINTNKIELTPKQKEWLVEHSLSVAPKDLALIPYIINLSSWSWLEKYMNTSKLEYFELFKHALGTASYISEITQSEQTRSQFMGYARTKKV